MQDEAFIRKSRGETVYVFGLATGRESGELVSWKVSWTREVLVSFRKQLGGSTMSRTVLVISDLCIVSLVIW